VVLSLHASQLGFSISQLQPEPEEVQYQYLSIHKGQPAINSNDTTQLKHASAAKKSDMNKNKKH